MSRGMRLQNAALLCAGLLVPGTGSARDAVEVDFNAATQEYCHIVRFSLGWRMPQFVDQSGRQDFLPKYSLYYDYEFRFPGLLSTTFLVRGVERIVGKSHYTTNLYSVDLSDPKAIAQPGSEEEWSSGTTITLRRDTSTSGARIVDRRSNYAELQGRRFVRTGDEWGSARLSPDRSLLIVESWTGKLGPGGSDAPGDTSITLGFERNRGKLFFDVYDADTGKKLITVTAKFNTIRPEENFEKTGWLTERYFFIPLDEWRERCLVCEFGRTR
jgi:hypothetical protein